MRIALVAPLAEAVPPKFYGGTERVVSWLAEELVRQGHRVTLFASAESETAAELVVCNESVRAGARFNLYNHSILFAATEPSSVYRPERPAPCGCSSWNLLG